MKKLPHSARYGLCFAVIYAALLLALFVNYGFIFIMSYFGIELDFLSDQFIWSLFWFHTGFCILGISLVAGDALLTQPDIAVETKLSKPTRKYMRTPYVTVIGMQWVIRLLYLVCIIAHITITVKIAIIWVGYFAI